MHCKRIIPCLDIKDGRTVKGVNFVNLRDAGDPVELAQRYSEEGADELVFLDITATVEGRKTFKDLVLQIAKKINIPFCVGGGIKSIEDISRLLDNGADKVSINSQAVREPSLLTRLANEFGSQCIVLAIDTKFIQEEWKVVIDGGRTETEYRTIDWAKMAEELGVGEILLTSMMRDGTRNGFSLDITKEVSKRLKIPVIASGGAGITQHFIEVFNDAQADAALAASIFHDRQIQIKDLKQELSQAGVTVRI